VNLPISFEFGGANARSAELDYWTGVAYAGSGDTQRAEEFWKQAIAPPDAGVERRAIRSGNAASGNAQSYYRGLAFQKLGQEEKAQQLFRDMVQAGHKELQQPVPANSGKPERQLSLRARKADGYYLAGLGYLGLNDQADAKAELSQAVQISPDRMGARAAMAWLR
jgi:tetratricopeptide (TPR) repeat protein